MPESAQAEQTDTTKPTTPPAGSPEGSAGPTPESIAPAIEAVLLSTDRPTPASKLSEAVASGADAGAEGGAKVVVAAIELLNAAYEATGRSFRIERLAGGYRIMTRPEFAEAVAAFRGARARSTLSRAGIETLAIVAYRQPVTRAQLEAIRGVACGEVLRTLLDRRLLTVVGRAEELGRPMLYGTTRQFLDAFGLSSLKDLPSPESGLAGGLGGAGNAPGGGASKQQRGRGAQDAGETPLGDDAPADNAERSPSEGADS